MHIHDFKKRRLVLAFTLIELLTVIGIIAILAALLFPVFARAKDSSKQTVDLSNIKQVAVATLLYVNDHDDTTAFATWSNFESIAARTLPYAKSSGIFKNSKSRFLEGAWNHREGCGTDTACVNDNAMMDPSSDCVGAFAHSKVGRANLYSDVYFPLDFEWNDSLSESRGPKIACTKTLETSPTLAANDGITLTSGHISNPAKAVMWADFPNSGQEYPGGCVDGVCDNTGDSDYWGSNFKGYGNDGSNLAMLDIHVKFFKFQVLHPCGHEICRAGGDQNATDWKAWGFTWASPTVQ